MVPSEARATIQAFREGCTLEKFLDDMWDRREAENPRKASAGAGWPYKSVKATLPQNVTALPARKRKP